MDIKIGDTVEVMVPWWNQAKFGSVARGVIKTVMPGVGDRQTYCLVQFANDDMWVGIDRIDLLSAKDA